MVWEGFIAFGWPLKPEKKTNKSLPTPHLQDNPSLQPQPLQDNPALKTIHITNIIPDKDKGDIQL